MKRLIVLLALLPLAALNSGAFAQRTSSTVQSTDVLLSRLPTELKLHEDKPQKYKLTFDYLHLDTLGNPLGKERVSGEYTQLCPVEKSDGAT